MPINDSELLERWGGYVTDAPVVAVVFFGGMAMEHSWIESNEEYV